MDYNNAINNNIIKLNINFNLLLKITDLHEFRYIKICPKIY